MTSVTKDSNSVVNYYHTWESILGYRAIKGVKHFGYYPEGQESSLSIEDAQLLMDEQIAKALALEPGSVVLDAGCGEGSVSIYMAGRHGFDVHGIDLLDFNISRARKVANERGLADKTRFQVGDYSALSFADNFFDGVYAIETLVHAPDIQKVFKEFFRVLKPGGKLTFFEYSLTKPLNPTDYDRQGIERIKRINRVSAMPTFEVFNTGGFGEKLTAVGFSAVTEDNITDRMLPMLAKLEKKAVYPYKLIKLLGLQDHFVNTMSAVEFYNHLNLWQYNRVAARKPVDNQS